MGLKTQLDPSSDESPIRNIEHYHLIIIPKVRGMGNVLDTTTAIGFDYVVKLNIGEVYYAPFFLNAYFRSIKSMQLADSMLF